MSNDILKFIICHTDLTDLTDLEGHTESTEITEILSHRDNL